MIKALTPHEASPSGPRHPKHQPMNSGAQDDILTRAVVS